MIHARNIALPIVIAMLPAMLLLTGCTPSKPQEQSRPLYAFWPEPPNEPRVQFLTSYSKASDVTASESRLQRIILGEETQQDRMIDKPYGLAMWDGKIYVCDIRNPAIVVLDLKKRQTRLMGTTGTMPLRHPVAIAVAEDGHKYVADQHRMTIAVFDAEERLVRAIGHPDMVPVGVAVHGDMLYVCDFKNADIKVFNRHDGQFVRTIGQEGGEDGQFRKPLFVATDRSGNVFVVDVARCRVSKFAPDGTFLMAFGQPGSRAGDFVRPKGIAVSKDDLIFVVDARFNNVQVFDEEGKVVGYFGLFGSHPGAMDLPAGLCISETDVSLLESYMHPAFQAERLVLVANQFGPNRVSVYGVGQLKPGRSMDEIIASRAEVTASGPPNGNQASQSPQRQSEPAALDHPAVPGGE